MDRRPIITQAGICWRCRARGGSITIKRAIRACLLAKHIPCPRYRNNATNKLGGSLISGTARIGSVMSRKSPSARQGQALEYSIGSFTWPRDRKVCLRCTLLMKGLPLVPQFPPGPVPSQPSSDFLDFLSCLPSASGLTVLPSATLRPCCWRTP